jgi:transposase
MSQETKKRTSLNQTIEYLKYSVASDISKDKFDACISIIDRLQFVKVIATRSFDNNPGGFNAFLEWQKLKCRLNLPVVFTMEATGIYYERLAWFLHRKALYVSVVLPNKAKKYMQGLGLKSKNDKIDAKGLAKMGAEQNLSCWLAPKESIMRLRDITRQRESFQEVRTQFNNQLQAYICSEFVEICIVNDLKAIIELLDNKIMATEKTIEKLVASDETLKERFDKVLKIKGVSTITIATLISETNCFEMFSSQSQLVSYAGYDVVDNQSGKHQGKTKISKKGNAHIRRILHMPAFNVVKYQESQFANLYERVYARTKLKMKGYVAVQRKLLCLIYTLWKNNAVYDSNYQQKQLVMNV